MLLRYSLGSAEAADAIDSAVEQSIAEGYRTGDIFSGAEGEQRVNTSEMGAAITERL